MDLDRTLSNRDASKLFDYLDERGLDDGSLRVADAVAAIVKSGRRSSSRHSHDYDSGRQDSAGGSRRSRSPRDGGGGGKKGGDGVARMFRKQPYLLEELVRVVKTMEGKGRPVDNLLRDCRSADKNRDGELNRVDFSE
jgi:hypothetical protein